MQLKPTFARTADPRGAAPLQTHAPASVPSVSSKPFMSVAEAAPILCLSEMTLYRAIHARQFPAVRIRGRYIIPTVAIDEMIAASIADGAMVDAARWVRDDTRPAS